MISCALHEFKLPIKFVDSYELEICNQNRFVSSLEIKFTKNNNTNKTVSSCELIKIMGFKLTFSIVNRGGSPDKNGK